MDSRVWLPVLFLLVTSLARAEDDKVRVTVLVAADSPVRASMEARLKAEDELPVAVRLVSLPEPSTVPESDEAASHARILSEARSRYVEADFEGCLARLPDDALLTEWFGRTGRSQVARVLMYRAACQAGRGAQAEAQRAAADLARLGLDVPEDVGAVTPDVERMLPDTLQTARAAPRATLRVQSEPARLTVHVDGRALGCLTPCSVELAHGDHIVSVSGDGYNTQVQRVTLNKTGSTVTLATTAASPDVALAQWRTRYAAGPGLDSAGSLTLLAQARR